jgi:hypothetical protein
VDGSAEIELYILNNIPYPKSRFFKSVVDIETLRLFWVLSASRKLPMPLSEEDDKLFIFFDISNIV